MDLIDDKYINLLSSRLQKFSKKGPNLYNCRCSICGDSQKNKNKARGYFYSAKNNTNYKCHNCGINISLNNFLKQIDPNLHQEYCLDKYSSGFTGKNFTAETPKFEFKKDNHHRNCSSLLLSSSSHSSQESAPKSQGIATEL